MKKNIAVFIYVPLLALLIAVTGFLLFYESSQKQTLSEEQIINLDEYFQSVPEENVQTVDDQNVVLPDVQETPNEPAKVQESAGAANAFVLGVVDDHVAVFENGETEVYMYTGIRLENLPDSTQSEVLAGKEIADEQALYFFLETYSS
ncbi:MAG: hypothetical protein LUH19_05570 [Lachnospiraceae bacterium]|nr:hypothetical protein [Lachnospiraceae bacterium]